MTLDPERCRVNSLVELPGSSPVAGVVRWDPAHSLWNGTMLAASLLLAPLLFSWGALAACLLLASGTLLLGHSVGFHRRLIHRSFDCPLWLERLLVWAGTLVGMSGPLWMIRTHDLRDWAQRQADCHDGPALPILSIIRAQVAAMTPPGIVPDMTVFDRMVDAIRAGHPPSDDAKSNPQTAMLASLPEQGISYLRSADRIDPMAALAKVRQPVLIVQGGRDDSVPPSHADLLRASRGNLSTEVTTFPNLTHFYKVAPAGMSSMQSMALDTPSDPAVAEAIAEWASRLPRQ